MREIDRNLQRKSLSPVTPSWVTVVGTIAIRLTYACIVLAAILLAVRLSTVPSALAGPNNCKPVWKCPTPAPTASPRPSLTPAPTVLPSLTPTPTATTDSQPAFPIRAAFYYPWFPESWNQQGYNPFTWYTPTLGFYDSSTPSVISAHVSAMQAAGVKAGIASWWGQGSATDQRMAALLAGAGTFRWAIYYEPEGTTDPSVASLTTDIDYIVASYGAQQSYLRVAGRPVIFVYNANDTTCSVVDRWTQANAGRAYLVLKVFTGYRTCATQPDSWHQYAPSSAEDRQAGYSFAISPGFWKRNETTPRLTRDINRWAVNVADMIASGEPWQLVTTFSEWGEGSQIEASTELGTAYLDVLGGGTAPPPTSTPTSPPPGTDPILMAAGDIACDPATAPDPTGWTCAMQATADLLPPATKVQTLGDHQYDAGSLTLFQTGYDTNWGAYKAKTNPGIGNHEGTSSGSGVGYCTYFGAAAHCNASGNQNGAAFYSYNLGAWHVIVLNSNCSAAGGCGVGSAQYNWLVADLAANPRACTLAAWHHARFSSGNHGSSTTLQPFWQALYDANADLILSGHDHDYERFAPQTPTGVADSARGIREFVVGTGGKNHYAIGTPIANSQVRNDNTYGVLRLDLRATSYDFRFVPVAGQTFTDSGTGACH